MLTSASRSPAQRVRCVNPVSVGVQMAAPTTHLQESSTAQVSTISDLNICSHKTIATPKVMLLKDDLFVLSTVSNAFRLIIK